MMHHVAGLGILLVVLAAAPARAEPPLELLDLPPRHHPAQPPAIPDWRMSVTAPEVGRPSKPGDVRLARARSLIELAPVRRQLLEDRPGAQVITLRGGTFELVGLARALGDPDVLERRGRTFVLRRPLVIQADATLRITGGAQLRLDTVRRVFVVNAGRLLVTGSEISSRDEAQGPTVLRDDRDFRPFVLAISGSWTEILDSTLAHLGYAAPGSWGLTLARRPAALAHRGAPAGRLIGNRIIGNYYGFYSYAAEDVVIAANEVRASIVYGIDPHSGSRRLVIADNTVVGTRRRHGIVLSRDVSDSWIIGNRSIGNAGSGIVLDRQSTGNLVAHNVVAGNRGDGLSLLESPHNRLWRNLALHNAGNGLRVRNSWAVEVQRNRFAHNGAHGVELYARRLWDQPGRDLRRDPYQVRLDLVLAHNWFAGNRSSALSLRTPEQLDLEGLYRASGSARAPAEPLRLGGELRLLADAIGARLAAAGGVRIRGRQSAEPDDRLASLPR